MNKIEFDTLNEDISRELVLVDAAMLLDQTPRTLVYGYTCERDTFHVYLAEDGIHKVIYDHHGLIRQHVTEHDQIRASECVPDKRLYPEACDFEFCALLKRRGVTLPFTTWNDSRRPALFHGLRFEELPQQYKVADFSLESGDFLTLAGEILGNRPDLHSDAEPTLQMLLQSVATSYLIASLPALKGYEGGKAIRWLDNLPESITHILSRLETDVVLSEEQGNQVKSRVAAIVQPKLDELLAR